METHEQMMLEQLTRKLSQQVHMQIDKRLYEAVEEIKKRSYTSVIDPEALVLAVEKVVGKLIHEYFSQLLEFHEEFKNEVSNRIDALTEQIQEQKGEGL